MTNIADKQLRDKVIISLWGQGLTGKEIAAVLGTTRSAILGRIHRMRAAGFDIETRDPDGLQKTKGSAKKKDKKNKAIERMQIEVSETIKDGRVTKKISIPSLQLNFSYMEDNEVEKVDTKTDILGLTAMSCRYVVEVSNKDLGAIYCGKDKYKRNYCEEHFRLCYTPAPKLR